MTARVHNSKALIFELTACNNRNEIMEINNHKLSWQTAVLYVVKYINDMSKSLGNEIGMYLTTNRENDPVLFFVEFKALLLKACKQINITDEFNQNVNYLLKVIDNALSKENAYEN